ncbi:MAG: hypothetical protein QOH71_2214 [Blastocatellia bacterium]|jgi:hypothetical protein|nr:hypothetical protein [Blastocatellia bacterium]
MSPRIGKLLTLFSAQFPSQTEGETQEAFTGTYVAPSTTVARVPPITVPEAQELKGHLDGFPTRDSVSVSIVIAGGDATIITTGDIDAVQAQLDQLRLRLSSADVGDTVSLTVTITKGLKDGEVTLYSPPLFLTHLETLSIGDRLGVFNDFVKKSGAVKLACDEPLARFGSRTVQFVTDGGPIKSYDQLERKPILAKRDDVAHFVNGAGYQLVPEDFNLIEPGADTRWQGLFAELTNVLTIAFTADYATFTKDNNLDFKLNGYKTLTGSLNSADLNGANWTAAFKIYQWTYEEGSISDRVGLLRNVLSLHLDSKGLPRYDEDVYRSVRSAFAIYLKRNVEQYIEVKNKLAEFLQTLSDRAAGDVDKYIDALRGTLGALITFFISTMILSAMGGRGLTGIFTTDITYLTYAFLAGSIVYLGISRLILSRQRKHNEANYRSLKDQYSGILDLEDLSQIFHDDKIAAISSEVKRQAMWITVGWVVVTLILGVVAFTLHRKEAALPLTTNLESKSTPTPQGPQTSP